MLSTSLNKRSIVHEATKFNMAHLILVTFTKSRFRWCTNCHRFSLSFGTLSFNFFVNLDASFSAEISSLDLVHFPCLNKTTRGISWSALGYLPKVRVRSNPWHTSLGEQLVLLVQNRTIDRAAATLVWTRAKLKHSNLKMWNWNTEYTDGNDIIYALPKQPPSNELLISFFAALGHELPIKYRV